MADEWWKDFFDGLMVDFWLAAIPQEVTRAEAAFLEEHLRLSPGDRVLDVPCGAGRLAVELAARGARVTGVDISNQFLEAAKTESAARKVDVEWRRGEMRDLPWSGEFDAAYCAGSSFGFLGDEGDAAFLRAVSRTLRPGARFFSDFKAAEAMFPKFRESYEMVVGGIEFRARNRYDPRSGTMESTYIATRDGRTETKRAVHRIYTTREILGMLSAAGFAELQTYGSVGGEAFTLGAASLLVVATKGV